MKDGTPINKTYLVNNLCREQVLSSYEIEDCELLSIIAERFDNVDYGSAIADLFPFVKKELLPTDWSSEHFRKLTESLTFC